MQVSNMNKYYVLIVIGNDTHKMFLFMKQGPAEIGILNRKFTSVNLNGYSGHVTRHVRG